MLPSFARLPIGTFVVPEFRGDAETLPEATGTLERQDNPIRQQEKKVLLAERLYVKAANRNRVQADRDAQELKRDKELEVDLDLLDWWSMILNQSNGNPSVADPSDSQNRIELYQTVLHSLTARVVEFAFFDLEHRRQRAALAQLNREKYERAFMAVERLFYYVGDLELLKKHDPDLLHFFSSNDVLLRPSQWLRQWVDKQRMRMRADMDRRAVERDADAKLRMQNEKRLGESVEATKAALLILMDGR